MLRDELDMLECRLTEMQDYDVTHVIVESLITHRGETKPLHYAENQERFRSWKGRIRNVTVPRSVFRPDAGFWEREHVQRNMAWLAMEPEPDDLVLVSDVDEIPSGTVLEHRPLTAAVLMQRVACFAVDWVLQAPDPTGVLVRAGPLNGRSLAEIRDNRGMFPSIPDAGWHLSWLGGPEAIGQKVAAHCHQECDEVLLAGVRDHALYERGQSIWPGVSLIPAEVDKTWPRYVYERRCPESWFRPRS